LDDDERVKRLKGSGNKLKKNPQNKDENINKENEEKIMKKGFFKKIWYSIDKVEKYSELSAEGFGKAIKYLATLIIILAIISSAVTVYRTSSEVKNLAQYIEDASPELNYNDGILTIDSQEPIIGDTADFGKIIIDTKADKEEDINKYMNEIQNEENSIIILKDKIILKEIGLQGTIDYSYKDFFSEKGITEFNKQDLVKYLTGNNMIPLYLNLFLVLFIYTFIIYFINTLVNITAISIFGYLATIILKLKIRYVAVFNMAVYAITLPTILDMIYIIVNAFFNYYIKYFNMMYILVTSIYMMAAIFILKSDFNKKQGEVQKIVEVEKELKKEMTEKQKEMDKKEKKEQNRDTDKKDKNNNEEEEEKQDKNQGQEPEGSNA